MGTLFVAIVLAVIIVAAFRATAKEMKKGGCAYCSSAMKPAQMEGQVSGCSGNCSACNGCCHH